jgi:hypothetical protein
MGYGGLLTEAQMSRTERCHYRGYEIVPQWQWSSWCAGIYPTRPDLPLLPRSTLDSLAPQKEEALADAKQAIDQILAQLGYVPVSGRDSVEQNE